MPNWKITIRPTRTGIRVRTQSKVQDIAAEHFERVITEALIKAAKKLERA